MACLLGCRMKPAKNSSTKPTLHIDLCRYHNCQHTSVLHFVGRSNLTQRRRPNLIRGLVDLHLGGGPQGHQEVVQEATSRWRPLDEAAPAGGTRLVMIG
jgi:hypothetical protein